MSTYGALGNMIRRYGFFDSQRVLTHLACAAIFVHQTGEEPTVPAMASFWGESERTTYRARASWVKVTGGADVAVAARKVLAAYDAELLSRESVTALTFEVAGFVPTS